MAFDAAVDAVNMGHSLAGVENLLKQKLMKPCKWADALVRTVCTDAYADALRRPSVSVYYLQFNQSANHAVMPIAST